MNDEEKILALLFSFGRLKCLIRVLKSPKNIKNKHSGGKRLGISNYKTPARSRGSFWS